MTYDELCANVRSYSENTFPDTLGGEGLTSAEQLASFTESAEDRIWQQVNLLELRKNVTGNATAGNKYLSVPTDWLANFSLAVIDPVTGGYDFLLNKDVAYIREAFPYPQATGKPTHYAMFDEDSYILGPTPDASYDMELHYFFYPESIVTAGTTWLSLNFPTVLLYGVLLEAVTYMKGEADVIAQYQKRYDEALGLLLKLGQGRNTQDNYRSPQSRVPVR